MEQIIWTPEFSVGVASLDEQHKRLIGMINKLVDDSGACVDSETISDILTQMTKYASMHFRAEEQLMAEHDYPGLAAHRHEHLEYRKKAVNFCLKVMDKRPETPNEIINFLFEWWTQHILHSDMKYKKFFDEHKRI